MTLYPLLFIYEKKAYNLIGHHKFRPVFVIEWLPKFYGVVMSLLTCWQTSNVIHFNNSALLFSFIRSTSRSYTVELFQCKVSYYASKTHRKVKTNINIFSSHSLGHLIKVVYPLWLIPVMIVYHWRHWSIMRYE